MNTLNANTRYRFYAGFSKRFFAWLIDTFIVTCIVTTIHLIFKLPTLFTVLHEFGHSLKLIIQHEASDNSEAIFQRSDGLNMKTTLLLWLVNEIITWLYFAIPESSSKQATLGKMALRIQVTDMYGERVSFWRATGRYWAKYISCLTLGIGYVITIFTAKKQALHDIIAGCLVVQHDPEQQLFDKKVEVENMKLEELKTKAELEALQAKINPHFLYNCLNSIASLVYDNPQKVEQMVIALSKFFRYSINTSGENYAKIKDEIELTKTYLEIEKIRFGDRLNFQFEISGDEDYLIPRFLIQPLVENAIKHGLSKTEAPGQLVIRVAADEKSVEVAVRDNGPDFPKELVSGYGLKSTYEKLNLLFPNMFEVHLINGKEKQIKIILKKSIKHA